MKMRIKGDSLRLRISPSEMSLLLESGRIEDTIHIGPAPDAQLTYALMTRPSQEAAIMANYSQGEIAVTLPASLARSWASGEQVGIQGTVDAQGRRLHLSVEKDFACLDKSAPENYDTYPHPGQGASC